MPRLINLDKMPSRKRRPEPAELPPWQPGRSGLRVLQYLYRYRYLTSDLLGLVYATEHQRGRYQVRQQLTKLWRHGLAERFYRPADWGSNQYAYTLSVEGARLIVDPKLWPEERHRIYNLAREKRDYEHALAVSLVHVLWDMGALSQTGLFTTVSSWHDKQGTKEGTTNEFEARVDGRRVRVLPDWTVLIAHQRRNYYRPYFFEVERSHKNYERLRQRFRAYSHLLDVSGHRTVAGVFQREVGLVPERGMVVFVGADRAHAERLRDFALTVVPRDTEFWFTSVDQLLEKHARRRPGGAAGVSADEETFEEECPIPPASFFTEPLLVNLDGKAGRMVI